MQALSCYIYIYTSITLHAIQTQNLTLTWDHNPKGAKLNFPVLGSHCGGLGLSWHPAFQAHVYFHSSSKKKKKKIGEESRTAHPGKIPKACQVPDSVHGKNQVHRFVGKRYLYPRSICTCSRVVLTNGTTLRK